MTDTNPELQAMSLPDLLAQTVDCRNGHHSWTERGHGPCSACGEPSPPPVLPQLECGCLQGACHGGHTIDFGMPVTVDEPEPIDTAKLRTLAADANRATLQPGYPFGGEGPSQWRCNVDAMLGGPTGEFCGAVSPNLIIRLLNDLDSAHALTAQLANRVDELEAADREHSQVIEYLHHAHGIDIDREDDDFREWQQQYGEASDHA